MTPSYEGVISGGEPLVIDPFPIIESVVEDLHKEVPVGRIAARFHNGMVRLLADAVRRAAETTGIQKIALSGGVFQNAYLSQRLEKDLAGMCLEVYSHVEVPANERLHFPGPGLYRNEKTGGRLKSFGSALGNPQIFLHSPASFIPGNLIFE